MLTVMFTCALGDYMESTMKCIKDNEEHRDVKIVGVDIRHNIYHSQIDAFYKVPACGDENYIPTILKICQFEGVNVIFPTNTMELDLFLQNKRMFESLSIKVALYGGIENVTAKHRLYETMKKAGAATAACSVINNYDEAEKFIAHCGKGKTYCIKPLCNCGARGFRILTNDKPSDVCDKGSERIPLSSLHEILENESPLIIQEYLAGNEYTVDMLCHKGNVLHSIVKRNERMINGVAQISKVVDFQDANSQCELVVKEARLSGNIGFDLKCDSRGKPYIIDCNPRLTATVALSKYAGINLPYLGLKYALGEKIPLALKIKHSPTCIRRWVDYFTFDESVGDSVD